MEEFTLKEKKMNALRWEENFSAMKHFCGKQCTISYETCAVDDYWLLVVKDSLKEKDVVVPIGDYVVEYNKGSFTVMNYAEIEYWFYSHGDEPMFAEEDKNSKKINIMDLLSSEKAPTEDYKEPINVETDGQQNMLSDIIPEGTKVKIVSCRHDNNLDYIYLNQIGKVLHYWKGNAFGEYNVMLHNGCNTSFDRDELEIVED